MTLPWDGDYITPGDFCPNCTGLKYIGEKATYYRLPTPQVWLGFHSYLMGLLPCITHRRGLLKLRKSDNYTLPSFLTASTNSIATEFLFPKTHFWCTNGSQKSQPYTDNHYPSTRSKPYAPFTSAQSCWEVRKGAGPERKLHALLSKRSLLNTQF